MEQEMNLTGETTLYPAGKDNSPDVFGGCPICGGNDGFLNIGRGHWFMCKKHKTKWCVGSNWFRCWRFETEDIWKNNFETLSEYREVPCVFPGEPKPKSKEKATSERILRLGSSREELIASGSLFDVTREALSAGFGFHTAISPSAWKACVRDPGLIAGDSPNDRLWTLLHSMRVTHGNTPESDEVRYDFGGSISIRSISLPTRVITVLLADEKIPFETPRANGIDTKKADMPSDVLSAIECILEYLWDDEKRDWQETDIKCRDQHIFSRLVTLRKWFDERSL